MCRSRRCPLHPPAVPPRRAGRRSALRQPRSVRGSRRQQRPRLPIHVAVLPALRRVVEPDPLFIFAGGPGQGARGMADVAARFFSEYDASATSCWWTCAAPGLGPLRCPEAPTICKLDPGGDARADLRDSAWRVSMPIRATTPTSNRLRISTRFARALGYGRINLWGGSWGTRAALLYALRFPHVDAHGRARWRRAARPWISAHGIRRRPGRARSADRPMPGRRPLPAAPFPIRARSSPRSIGASARAGSRYDPASRATHRRNRSCFLAVLPPTSSAALFTCLATQPRVLDLIHRAADGDFAPLAAQHLRTAAWTTDDMALGATLSVLCSEDLPSVAAIDFAADANGSSSAPAMRTAGGRAAPTGRGQRHAGGATISSAPALILSGVHDPVTPPRTGELMGRHFPRHRHVVVPGAAHNASFRGCVPDLIARVSRATDRRRARRRRARASWPGRHSSSATQARVHDPRRRHSKALRQDRRGERCLAAGAQRVVTGLLGPNGAGKTTTLRAITGSGPSRCRPRRG